MGSPGTEPRTTMVSPGLPYELEQKESPQQSLVVEQVSWSVAKTPGSPKV